MSSTSASTSQSVRWQPQYPPYTEQHESVSIFLALSCQLLRSPTRFLWMTAATKACIAKESYVSSKEPVFVITIKVFVWSLLWLTVILTISRVFFFCVFVKRPEFPFTYWSIAVNTYLLCSPLFNWLNFIVLYLLMYVCIQEYCKYHFKPFY